MPPHPGNLAAIPPREISGEHKSEFTPQRRNVLESPQMTTKPVKIDNNASWCRKQEVLPAKPVRLWPHQMRYPEHALRSESPRAYQKKIIPGHLPCSCLLRCHHSVCACIRFQKALIEDATNRPEIQFHTRSLKKREEQHQRQCTPQRGPQNCTLLVRAPQDQSGSFPTPCSTFLPL